MFWFIRGILLRDYNCVGYILSSLNIPYTDGSVYAIYSFIGLISRLTFKEIAEYFIPQVNALAVEPETYHISGKAKGIDTGQNPDKGTRVDTGGKYRWSRYGENPDGVDTAEDPRLSDTERRDILAKNNVFTKEEGLAK